MAFGSFASAAQGPVSFGAPGPATAGPQAQEGPELEEIQTEQLGFQSFNGDAKLRLLPSPWPSDRLPPPSASLLGVASRKGLVAAAGPDRVVVVSTETVRNALRGERRSDDVHEVQPEVTIPVPRISQLAFSADENVLAISAEEQGGIAAYEVDGLAHGRTDPALQIPTNNTGLRALIPNPLPESGHLFAAVTNNGELLIADLKSKQLLSGPNGNVLRNGVSCLSWSNKGKQLVAGQADGTASQLKPDGSVVAEIPRPPTLELEKHVSAISWLENDVFFAIYTPNASISDGMMAPSDYYIISRQPKTTNFGFQKLPEVCPPFGLERLPSFHFISRLRNFPPHLQDLMILASTNSIDLGLVTRADAPLSIQTPVTGTYTYTVITDETRRGQLPVSLELGDTSPIGLAIDLSAKENVTRPIPSDPEIEESSTPLPSLLLLNHEGILVSWWIVYTESVRQKTPYPGLSVANDSLPSREEIVTPTQLNVPVQSLSAQPAFGQSGFGGAPSFGKPAAATFGQSSTGHAFGGGSGFGSGSSALGTPATSFGEGKSSWASTGFGSSAIPQTGGSGFGQPGFGTSTPLGGGSTPAFGAPAALGARPAAFGQAPATSNITTNAAPAFGQPGGLGGQSPFGGGSNVSPFVAKAADDSKPSGFASFSQQTSGGFAGFGAPKPDGASPFVKPSGESPFSKQSKPDSGFTFGSTKPGQSDGLFGTNQPNFKLGSTFQGDGSARDDLPKPENAGSSFFGGLGDILGEPTKNFPQPFHKEADMDDGGDPESAVGPQRSVEDSMDHSASGTDPRSLVTPPSTIMQSKATPAAPLSNLFGTSTQPGTTPASVQNSKPTELRPHETPIAAPTGMFGTSTQPGTTPATMQNSKPSWSLPPPLASTTPKESPRPKAVSRERLQPFSPPESPEEAPKIKAEPPSDDESQDLNNIPEAPLPPDSTSKTAYTAGDISVSSGDSSKTPSDDAPLPPDFIPAGRSALQESEGEDGPEGEEQDGEYSSDFEGSGEDVEGDISPIEEPSAEHSEQLHMSPESSFGRGGEKSQDDSPTGGLFTKVTPLDPLKNTSRTLFGEIGTGPMFPPPKPQESPRSPSPVRNVLQTDHLRPEAARSVSAPLRPSVIDRRKAEAIRSGLGAHQIAADELRLKERQRIANAAEAKAKAEAEEAQPLEDDEDERLRAVLANPVMPSDKLENFIFHEHSNFDERHKVGIPGQIERLYQDINSMIDTLGINERYLTGFMLFQQNQEPNKTWPEILGSETPLDTLNDQWVLSDIMSLHEGQATVGRLWETNKITDLTLKLQQCQDLLSNDLSQFRAKLNSMRKTIHAQKDAGTATSAPLSAEQASLQHDLRRASTSVQSKIAEAEQTLTMLRAKLAENVAIPGKTVNGASKLPSRAASQQKPSVEAVTNTIAKMTSMAEKKRTDVDFLEAQLKKMSMDSDDAHNGSRQTSVEAYGTPQKTRSKLGSRSSARTPGSNAGSVYHTPDSKFGGSTRGTPVTAQRSMRTSLDEASAMVSNEHRGRWRERAQRRIEVTNILKEALAEKREKARAARQQEA